MSVIFARTAAGPLAAKKIFVIHQGYDLKTERGRAMYKKFVVLALLVSFGFFATGAYAECSKCGKKEEPGLDEKFYMKAGLIIKSQDELGLSDEQVKKVKDLKHATKKDLIMKEAEIEVIAVDIKAALWEDKIDLAAINGLIDKKYEIKKGKAKALVAAYATLKGLLTAEQLKSMKALYSQCSMKGDMKGGMKKMGR